MPQTRYSPNDTPVNDGSAVFGLKGQLTSAQGNALGKWHAMKGAL
jgi:hypothetical protein